MGVRPFHEAVLDVARRDTAHILELLRLGGLDYDIKELRSATARSENANRPYPRERRIDLVARLVLERGPLMVPMEVHRRNKRNPAALVTDARRKWAADVALLSEEHEADAVMLVISDCDEVASEASKPIELGPGSVITPIAFGPSRVRLITDPDDPAATPGAAMMSAIFHGNGPQREAVLNALDHVLDRIGKKEEAGHRIGVVMTVLDEESAKVLEAIMATTKFEYHSAWTDSLREEGELRAARAMLLDVLTARSIEATAEQRERIESTTDLEQLRAWLLDAISASSSEEIFL